MTRTETVNFAQTPISPPNDSQTVLVWETTPSALFPTTNFYAVIEEIEDGVPTKQEVVFCSSRTGTSFTVTRWQDGSSAQAFYWDVRLSLNIVSAHIQDIWDEVEDNYTELTTVPTTAKTTPVDADHLSLRDSAASNILKKVTRANVKATLKTYFDTLYVALTWDQTVAWVKTFSSFPVTPSSAPTTAYQVGNKQYVDDKVAWVGYQHLEAVSVDTAVNSASDVTILAKSLTGIAVGDIVEVEIIGNVLINPWWTRALKYTFTLWTTTVFLSDNAVHSASDGVVIVKWYFTVISTSSVYASMQLDRGTMAAVNTAQAVNSRSAYNTSSNNETGTKTLTFYVASTDTTATQTFKLRWFKFLVLKKTP